MGEYIKIKKNLWILVIPKPEHENLRRKTAIKAKFEFSRKNKQFLIADTKLQFDQSKRKVEANSISHFIFKNQIFWKSNWP